MQRYLLILVTILLIAVMGNCPVVEATELEKSSPELKWQFSYDDAGRIAGVTGPGGKETKISYEFTERKRLKRIARELPDSTKVGLEFDGFGRCVLMTDGAGSVRYDHDELGLLKAVRREGQPAIAYAYDTLNRLSSVSLGEGTAARYAYDFLGRLDSIETPAGRISYEYQRGQGMVIRALPNGIRTVWRFAPDGSLESISHVAKDNRVLLQFAYSYRTDGLIRAVKELSSAGEKTVQYDYDLVQRLSVVAASDGQRTGYRYDQLGNRTATTVDGQDTGSSEYDWAGRMTRHNGQECAHDAGGNLASYAGKDGKRVFGFNAMNLLESASVGDRMAGYQYDGDGNLIARKSEGKTTSFVPDPLAEAWRPLLAIAADGQRTLYVWEGDSPLVMITGKQVRFLLHDHLGSVRAVADAQGNIVERYDYGPFGESREQPAGDGLSPGFAGLFYDPQVSLYLTRARGLDPTLGRFLQPDPQWRIPFGSQKDLSQYGYCGGDPVNFLDLSGAEARREWELQNWPWQAITNPLRLFDAPYAMDWWGNFIGRQSNWFGRNVTGGRHWVTQRDAIGQLPLGDTRVPGKTWWDQIARMHDIEYFISAHPEQYPKDRQVSFAGPHGTEYYTPGWVAGANLRLGWRLVFQGAIRGMFSSPQWPDIEGRHSPIQNRQSNTGGFPGVPSPSDWTDRDWEKRFFPPGGPPPDDHGGGGGAVAGFGLLPPAGRGGGALDPSTVGGVYLGGAGEALKHLGPLQGVALDANNNVVLLSRGNESIPMPPSRVDDVVTVFRSVYLNGEGPTVTIDPNPENPEGSAMIIRHSKATENTYVGWVLYQADRLMKGYTLGVDNKTQKDVQSAVPGFATILETIYFGGKDPGQLRKEGHWERFWIVPAAVRRFEGNRRELALLDVPLKAKTQTMKWQKGELVDDSMGKSSPGALAFTDWFTTNYDLVAKERYLTPPPESGLTDPVPVFAELRRIALITAIAEKLRDQGVPLPFWMRDYEVRPVPFEKTTPGLMVTRSNQRMKAQVYGGVELSPESKDVKVFSAASGLAQAPEGEKPAVREAVKLADSLEEAVRSRKTSAAPLEVEPFIHQEVEYQALAMPGAETRALAPCRLSEVDLEVPVGGARALQLVRSHNSFFEPDGPWGRGWTMDLPRLVETRVPIKREGDRTEYRVAYELATPLNRLYARFSDVKPVPALNNSQLQVPDKECEFYGLADSKPEFLSGPTRKLILKDGSSWHFSQSGDLVMSEEAGLHTVYERDNQGRVTRIVGMFGKQPRAFIRLLYNASGRLESAEGENAQEKQTVRYRYGEDGKLASVVSQSGTLGYQYQGFWVSTVTSRPPDEAGKQQAETVLCRFVYNPHGQLLSESSGDKYEVQYQVSADAQGHKVAATRSGDPSATEFIRYDKAYRPVEAQHTDGTRALWAYEPQGDTVLKLSGTDGEIAKLTQTAGRRQRTLELPDGYKAVAQYDEAGRCASWAENARPVIRQQWYPDGRLRSVETETGAVHPEYADDGLLSGVLLTPPNTGERAERWQKTKLDPEGRPTEVTDYSGLHQVLSYDGRGKLTGIVTKRDGKNYGFDIARDKSGRVLTVKSSWGMEQRVYDANGALAKVEMTKQTDKAAAEYKSGLPQRVEQFDGAETRMAYYEEGTPRGLPRQIHAANGLLLSYDYDPENRLSNVNCGDIYRLQFIYNAEGRLKGIAQEPLRKPEQVPGQPRGARR